MLRTLPRLLSSGGRGQPKIECICGSPVEYPEEETVCKCGTQWVVIAAYAPELRVTSRKGA